MSDLNRRQLKQLFPRGTRVEDRRARRRGTVTGYGRESVNFGTVRVTFDGTTTSTLLHWQLLHKL